MLVKPTNLELRKNMNEKRDELRKCRDLPRLLALEVPYFFVCLVCVLFLFLGFGLLFACVDN